MAVQQTNRVHALPRGACSAPERLLLYILSDFARPDGTHIFPGKSLLAARTGHSVRWVQMVKARLIARGWLIVERAGGGRLRTWYRLAIPNLAQAPRPQGVSEFSTGFPQFIHRGDQSITPTGDRSITAGVIDRSDHRMPEPAVAATACPVENAPIRHVPVSTDQPSSTERAREEADDTVTEETARRDARARLDHLKAHMLRAVPAPSRRRRAVAS